MTDLFIKISKRKINIDTLKSQKKIFEFLFVLFAAALLVYFSHKVILTYYFWRDDWIALHTTLTNPYAFLDNSLWIFNNGLLSPIHRFLTTTFQSHHLLQVIGLLLKIINVTILYYLIKTLTGSRRVSIIGFLFYSVYSGGLEAYSWVRPNGLLIGYIMLVFIFLHRFLDNKGFKIVFASSLVFWLSTLMIFGKSIFLSRAVGVVIPYTFWIFAYYYKRKEFKFIYSKKVSKPAFVIFFTLIIMAVLYSFYWVLSFRQLTVSQLFHQIYTNRGVYLGSTGSLLSNPYYYTPEQGALAGVHLTNIYFGVASIVLLILSIILFLKTRSNFFSLVSLALLWIHSAYIINWLFGGGGTSTAIGSSHRYLAVSAIGVVLLTSVILSKIPRKLSYILLLAILILSFRYTKRITEHDFWIRGEPIVGHFYSTVAAAVPEGEKARVILVDAPDNLKAPVVNWSLPWAYAYYNKISYSDFPVVFAHVGGAVDWLCADGEERSNVGKRLGVMDNRNSESVILEEIYAWKLAENGDLENNTDSFRLRVKSCLEDKGSE